MPELSKKCFFIFIKGQKDACFSNKLPSAQYKTNNNHNKNLCEIPISNNQKAEL